MKYNKIEIVTDNWQAFHDLEEHVPFCLSLNHQINQSPNHQILISGISIGDLSENNSLPQKAVMHEFMEAPGYSVETQSVIPFGSEPVINRKFEYISDIIKIATDIQVRQITAATDFEVDSLVIKGKWQKFALINLSAPGKKIKWEPLKPDSIIYDSDTHFHILLLEDADGMRMEIGAGFDLFRWNVSRSSDDGGSAVVPLSGTMEDKRKVRGRFSITAENDRIIIRRQIMTSDQEFVIQTRNWRFHWYLAWGTKVSGVSCQQSEKYTSTLKNSRTSELKNSSACFHAKKTRNKFRKAVRGLINKVENEQIVLPDIEPRICSNSSHIAKPGRQDLEHGDMTDIIDFWFWANKQLLTGNSSLIVIPPENSIFAECPSFIAMQKGIKSKYHE